MNNSYVHEKNTQKEKNTPKKDLNDVAEVNESVKKRKSQRVLNIVETIDNSECQREMLRVRLK
jgi:hypothetical protein